jgi:hypothetical protein
MDGLNTICPTSHNNDMNYVLLLKNIDMKDNKHYTRVLMHLFFHALTSEEE